MEAYELQPGEIRQPLNITAVGRRFTVTHFLRLPALADWIAYDAALGVTAQDVDAGGGELGMVHRDNRTAALGLLWERLIVRVEGYAFAEGDWKPQVPFTHRLGAVSPRTLVVAVAPSQSRDPAKREADAETLYTPGFQEVHLLAAGEVYGELVHLFREASAETVIRFNRASAERIFIRGTRKTGAKAIIPSMFREYAGLYDALIQEVRGYTIQDKPPESREQIIAAMDGFHKVVSLKGLFLPPLEEAEPET